MNTKTYCQSCNQPIEYDGEYGGVHVACPSCSSQVFLPKTAVVIPPRLTVSSHPKQKSVVWGVFLGLVGFFIILPICLLIFMGGCGAVIGGCAAVNSLSDNNKPRTTQSSVATSEKMSDSVDIDSDDALVKTGNVVDVINLADECLRNKCYNRATKLYLYIAIQNKRYPKEAVVSMIKVAKYCYMNLSPEKRRSIDAICGDTFYNDFKNGNENI